MSFSDWDIARKESLGSDLRDTGETERRSPEWPDCIDILSAKLINESRSSATLLDRDSPSGVSSSGVCLCEPLLAKGVRARWGARGASRFGVMAGSRRDTDK